MKLCLEEHKMTRPNLLMINLIRNFHSVMFQLKVKSVDASVEIPAS